VDKTTLDVSQIFLVFMSLVGDVEKTALACDLDPDVVRALAEQEGWTEKIRRVSLLSKSEKAGDYEKCVNRALNFAQAHIFRSMVQKVLDNLSRQDGNQLLTTLSSVKAGAVTYSAKLFSDLASAMEKAHHLSYLALGDETANRGGIDGEEQKADTMKDVHASVLAALNHPIAAGAERNLLENAIEDLVKATVPKKPDIEV
jgi:hypothetical protein